MKEEVPLVDLASQTMHWPGMTLRDAAERALAVLEYVDSDLVHDYTPKARLDERRGAIAALRAALGRE